MIDMDKIHIIKIQDTQYRIDLAPVAEFTSGSSEQYMVLARLTPAEDANAYIWNNTVFTLAGRHTGSATYYTKFYFGGSFDNLSYRINCCGINYNTGRYLKFFYNSSTHIIYIVGRKGDYNYTEIKLLSEMCSDGRDYFINWQVEDAYADVQEEWGEELDVHYMPNNIEVEGQTLIIEDSSMT